MDDTAVPATGTCDLSTVGRRSGTVRRVETWYVVVDGRIVVTGTPGTRDWLANLRQDPGAILHLRDPDRALAVTAQEVTDRTDRLRIVAAAWRLQPWYAEQPFSVEDWVARSPMAVLVPAAADRGGD